MDYVARDCARLSRSRDQVFRLDPRIAFPSEAPTVVINLKARNHHPERIGYSFEGSGFRQGRNLLRVQVDHEALQPTLVALIEQAYAARGSANVAKIMRDGP